MIIIVFVVTGMEQSYERVLEQSTAFMLELRAEWILEVEEILMTYRPPDADAEDMVMREARSIKKEIGEKNDAQNQTKAARLGLPSGIEMYVKAVFRMPMSYTQYPTHLHSLCAMRSSRMGGEDGSDQWRGRMSEIGFNAAAQVASGPMGQEIRRSNQRLKVIEEIARKESEQTDLLKMKQHEHEKKLIQIDESLQGLRNDVATLVGMMGKLMEDK